MHVRVELWRAHPNTSFPSVGSDADSGIVNPKTLAASPSYPRIPPSDGPKISDLARKHGDPHHSVQQEYGAPASLFVLAWYRTR